MLFAVNEDYFAEYLLIENAEFRILNKDALLKVLHTSPNAYIQSRNYFESECQNMLDFIRWYNLLDCHLLVKSIEVYAASFLEEWDTNVHEFKSVSFF